MFQTHTLRERDEQVYDIIFAGGGTSACVTAGRLAAADPTLKILILEAGPHTKDLPQVTVPGLFLHNIFPNSSTAIFHVANASKELNNRAPVLPVARCVGGGSSINWLMYTRPSACDFDEWKTTYGNEGWGAADMLPLLKKSETYQIAANEPSHGYDGPLKVSYGGMVHAFGPALLDVMAKYDPTRGATDDSNDLHTVNKWARWGKWIDEGTGKRSDVASNYIYNQEANQNLVVSAGCCVRRVIVENGRAAGVEYVYNPKVHPQFGDVQSMTARASKLIVIGAGAFGSPAILERSGIGAQEVLKSCDIEQVVDLPGVGAEYQDHSLVGQVYVLDDNAETIDFAHAVDEKKIAVATEEWKKTGSGPLSTNGMDVCIKMRPQAEDLEMFGSALRTYWQAEFEGKPDKPLMQFAFVAGMPNSHEGLPQNIKLSLFEQWLNYPLSKGRVHIKSSNVEDPLSFDCGFLDDPLDLEVLRWAYKKAREISRRHPMYRGEFRTTHPNFPSGSKAAVQDPPALPVPPNHEHDLVYSEEDDKAIDEHHRKSVQTTWHGLGTCPMKHPAQGGVVDSALNVYGVQGLKVADLSIVPHNVGGNTNATAIVIGEKAAVIIGKELGIKSV